MIMQTNLKRYLADHGWSAYRLEKETGLSHNTVYRLMRYEGVGNLYTWRLIADALGCTIDDIINYGEVCYVSE